MNLITLHSMGCTRRSGWWEGGLYRTPDCISACKEFELRPEVKEPDYSLLVKWFSTVGFSSLPASSHGANCARRGEVPTIGQAPCTCGLAGALRAAQIE